MVETVRKDMAGSVADFIKTMNTTKTAIELDILRKIVDTIQSSNRGHASEIIDLTYAVTGYSKADIPGGESLAAGNCMEQLVKYLVLRAKQESSESLSECLLELITRSVRLHGEVHANLGTRVVSLQPDQRKTVGG
jgi:hypothetical protein